ncbi:hypothetical protein ABZW11_38285 [Nonomuraea sp. NPDC004580]|uniref:hypothetical protein n=1 Tax=Nonomuraea sp. NPDC004580 TaxID=3154552 RepID=UPI0033B15C7D
MTTSSAVAVLAGSDANEELGDALAVPYGESLHDELIDGDPLADITATRNVLRVWCAGVERS